MATPDYQTLMLPVLKLAADGAEHKFSKAVEILADQFSLTGEERSELLPSGSQSVFNNRVGWARSYLKQAGLLGAPKRGFFTITEAGRKFLQTNPAKIDASTLEQFPEFIEFRNLKRERDGNEIRPDTQPETKKNQTPEDALASAYTQLRNTLESELLSLVKDASPSFFERLVVGRVIN